MKIYILLFIAFLPSFIYCQDARIRVISQKKASDSTTIQVFEFILQNDKDEPICISISPEILGINLNKDTIELAVSDKSNMQVYNLEYTTGDTHVYAEPNPRYPLVLNRLASFSVFLKVVRRNIYADAVIEFSYLHMPGYKYESILERVMSGGTWGEVLLKIQKKSIRI